MEPDAEQAWLEASANTNLELDSEQAPSHLPTCRVNFVVEWDRETLQPLRHGGCTCGLVAALEAVLRTTKEGEHGT